MSGHTNTQWYPLRCATSASPTPVLPAMRSFELPPGLRYSILAATVAQPSGTTELSRTRGVLPIRSETCWAMRMQVTLLDR
ncbi:Uncharacterised protein [Mycobacteroides abscessus subsp. abscessus]|nr:Uncharacterised protein [Mycobacteroides abscessus subsp. abscessus]